MSSSTSNTHGFLSSDSEEAYVVIDAFVREEKQPRNIIDVERLFPEINTNQTDVQTDEVNQEVVSNNPIVMKEVKVESDIGEYSQASKNDGGILKEIFLEKDITRSQKRGDQVLQFPQEVIKKALRPDITQCLLIDLDTHVVYECKIIKSKRKYVEMYVGDGWYAYAKEKKLMVGDKMFFHYNSEKEILYVRLSRRRRKNNV
ncbi:uncharacterized protein LOC131652948 [Vicia villosa]|uniref:uncharacterized protein LOC131633227 n=1 Tax=Vicia villosa TaxID=3911 RepID=UPI00273AD575|nr:uncharacterized protein LOC131633227 [Vicia villosa]XP_058778927.1 uncharacterized protein LOC131652948 [Vicia villosa]